MSQAEMGAAVGVRREMWARYESGTEPGATVLAAAVAAGVDVLYVLTGQRTPAPSGQGVLIAAEGVPPPGPPYPFATTTTVASGARDPAPQHLTMQLDGATREYVVIDHITEPVCAGLDPGAVPGAAAGAAHTPLGRIAFERGYMANALGRNDGSYLTLTVEGDSMIPTLLDGDLVAIDTQARRVNVSGIYVLRFDGDLTIKRVTKRSDGSLVISSDNPQYARAEEAFTRDQASTLQVIGRMVWPRVR